MHADLVIQTCAGVREFVVAVTGHLLWASAGHLVSFWRLQSLQYCNMSANLEVYIENVRQWFTRKIILPLSEQIERVDQTLTASGLSHLCSRFPATYSMAAKSLDGDRMRSHLFLSSPPAFSEPKIQSLMDLAHSRPNDPTVRARLRIERYLSIAAIASHRATLIKRVSALAGGSFLNSHHLVTGLASTASPTTSSDGRSDPLEDTQVSMTWLSIDTHCNPTVCADHSASLLHLHGRKLAL